MLAAFYLQHEYWFAAFQLVLAMLGMGATLTTRDFVVELGRPRSVIIGITMQLLLVPALAFIFIQVCGLSGGIAVGIALIAAIPGGTTSNIFTYLAHGNITLSICITAITTLACVATTPMILSFLITDYMPADFTMPTAKIINEIALTLLLPLAIGMTYRHWLPTSAPIVAKWCIRGSLFGVLLIVLGSIVADRLDSEAFGIDNILLVCLFTALLMILGFIVPRSLGLSPKDATATTIEVVVRNANLGVMIKASIFPAVAGVGLQLGDMVLFTILLYGGLQLIFGAAIISFRRYRTE